MEEKYAAMTPAQRITMGRCPECAESLDGLSAIAHANSHWEHPIRPNGKNDDAIARERMLYEYHKAQGAN